MRAVTGPLEVAPGPRCHDVVGLIGPFVGALDETSPAWRGAVPCGQRDGGLTTHRYGETLVVRGQRVQYGFTRHARLKMRQLGLAVDDVTAVIADRDVIERYAGRKGELLYGHVRGMEVHVSVVRQRDPRIGLVTTVYRVDRVLFPDGRTRRSST